MVWLRYGVTMRDFLNIPKLYVHSTANLGDFLNVLPVLSGLSKHFEYSLLLRPEMRKFKGIKEFLEYQELFAEVKFADEQEVTVIPISSWTREDQSNRDTPIETCRYENFIKDTYNIDFNVDNDFVLKVPGVAGVEIEDVFYAGDRWNDPEMDMRRNSSVLAKFDKLKFLDFNNDMATNAYIIKNLKKPFISTFTGISVLADLLNVEQYVIWGNDIRNWDNKPIEYSFAKHFYGNRKSKLMYIDDFERDIYDKNYNI